MIVRGESIKNSFWVLSIRVFGSMSHEELTEMYVQHVFDAQSVDPDLLQFIYAAWPTYNGIWRMEFFHADVLVFLLVNLHIFFGLWTGNFRAENGWSHGSGKPYFVGECPFEPLGCGSVCWLKIERVQLSKWLIQVWPDGCTVKKYHFICTRSHHCKANIFQQILNIWNIDRSQKICVHQGHKINGYCSG